MLTLIIADAALETIPEELRGHPSVTRHAKSRGKKPGEMLLDRSHHHAAMLKMKDHYRRGRPDLVHIALLEATSTPLYLEDRLKVCLHTIGGRAIFIGESVRLPKSYFRFEGLMEQLFREGEVVSERRRLLEVVDMSFKGLLRRVEPSETVGLSRVGRPSSFEGVAGELAATDRPVLVVGGFPRGHFTEATYSCLDKVYSVSRHPLETNVVIARVIYEYEKVTGK
ncbi:MAG: ribosome biogenesis protein [Nitrososphaerales archaeon]